jgi:carbon-monoxide dehydrogenase medium subunit
MTLWREFRQPKSISEAIEDLIQAPQPAVPIAGGTDLLLDIRQGRHTPPHTLIDLTAVSEMNQIEARGDEIFIGAVVPINRLTAHPLVQDHAQALIEACSLIAGPQVRNTATLGGNVAHALPAADGTIALVALDAQAEIADSNGLRRVPFIDRWAPGPEYSHFGR